MYLASRGFAVINASYRLAPRHTFPAPLEDVGKKVEWVFHHSDEYGLDLFESFLCGRFCWGAFSDGIYGDSVK